jgi:RNA polymerase sigma factor (sigma-70 family)
MFSGEPPHHLSRLDRHREMTPADPLLLDLIASRERFLDLVAGVRPELHRFCARMTGSVADGEDLVQETLTRAFAALSQLEKVTQLRSWLFRMAHNRAIDHMRAYEHRMREPLGDMQPGEGVDEAIAADDRLARDEAVRAALSRFVELPSLQRSCVILKDVLEHSILEIAELLEVSDSAVQAALHRGRVRLHQLQTAPPSEPAPERSISPAAARYAALFNARDWDALRAMLADDVRLDVVLRGQRKGRQDVGIYFTNYAGFQGWQVVPGWLDGNEVLAVFRDRGDAQPSYFIEVVIANERVVSIRDYRHVPYIAVDARLELAETLASLAHSPS